MIARVSMVLVLLGLAVPVAAQRAPVVDEDLPPEARQFDFWLGEWDVVLRVKQDDNSWEPMHRADARIYPILRGKAVLELWDSERIKGYSLRYFDPAEEKWILWLNWPGPDRAGSSRLTGSFRHGRGEFFSVRPTQDGGERIARYTFSDVSPTSLRWDDAYSTDGGGTWTHNWIMEFTRREPTPELPPDGGEAHTFHTGERCGLAGFRSYEFLAGAWDGTLERDGRTTEAEMLGYRVLDGCAVIALVRDRERAWSAFAHLTYNTRAGRLEILSLDSRPQSPAHLAYSAEGWESLLFEHGREEPAPVTVALEREGERLTWRSSGPDGATWTATFERR